MKVNIETERTIVLETVFVPSCVTLRSEEDALEIEIDPKALYAISQIGLQMEVHHILAKGMRKLSLDANDVDVSSSLNKICFKHNFIRSVTVIKAFNSDGVKTYQFNMTIKEKKEIRMGEASVEHLAKALEDWEEEKKIREAIVADNICDE